ncbi:MAG: response regulator transcription factor [Mucilaginibacter sp.]|nr:response regulator transcription factor [Mucilaginibacter sp.]
MTLNCLIIDDEPYAVELLEMFIKDVTSWNIVGKCYEAQHALEMIRDHQPQLLFLDINMPKLTGLELAEMLPPDVKVVFTTAYSVHAAESYRFHTLDYLLKPISLKRFLVTVAKVAAYFTMQDAASLKNPGDAKDFYFKSGKTLHKIRASDILYFEGQREYVRLVTTNEQLLLYRRLKDIGEQLGLPFIRIHNSYIINMQHVIKVVDNHVYVSDIQIPISDKFRDSFLNAIRDKLF